MKTEDLVAYTKRVDEYKDKIKACVPEEKREEVDKLLEEVLTLMAQISTDIAVEQALQAFVAQVKSAAEAGQAMQEKDNGTD